MGANPLHGFKTSSVTPTSGGSKTGKATAPGSTGSSPSTGVDTYVDDLMKAGGYQKPADSKSTDPTGDLLATLDKISKEGVPDGNLAPFPKISAESALSKYPEMAAEIVTKFNAIIDMCKTVKANLQKSMASGTGTPQQVQAAQKFNAQLDDLISYNTVQRDKSASHGEKQSALWKKELGNFMAHGGSDDPRKFDLNHDGHLGPPNGPDSYQIIERKFDKSHVDMLAKELHDHGADIQYQFKKGEIQYWAGKIGPDGVAQRVKFDPVTFKVVNDQIAAPGYKADMGVGFGDVNNDNVAVSDKGQLLLHTSTNPVGKHFAEAGLELRTPEYLYVEIDSEGLPVRSDQGSYKIAPFEMKDGHLVQKTPPMTGDTQYKQVYVTKMDVSSDDGDMVIRLSGGKDVNNGELMTMRITGPNTATKATDTALAITSGEKESHRETPVIIDASGYESTSRKGIKDPNNFSKQFQYQNGKAVGANAAQINDTLKGFVAASGKDTIDATVARNRGIAFRTRGHITADDGNNLIVVEDPPSSVNATDADGKPNPAYTTVIEGGAGKNAVFGGKGSLFASGMTLVSKDSGDANDAIGIGTNAYDDIIEKDGRISSQPGKSSNKLYVHVDAKNADYVAIQSLADGLNNPVNKGQGDEIGGNHIGWDAGDDFFDIKAKQIGITAIDGDNPSLPFDPDLAKTQKHNPLKGKIVAAGQGDISMGGGGEFAKRSKELDKAITTPATDSSKGDWIIDGLTTSVTSPYQVKDNSMLDTFFSDFNAGKLKKADPFFQEIESEKKAAEAVGGDDEW